MAQGEARRIAGLVIAIPGALLAVLSATALVRDPSIASLGRLLATAMVLLGGVALFRWGQRAHLRDEAAKAAEAARRSPIVEGPHWSGDPGTNQPSAARITEIDISRHARALAVLRWSDYVLFVGCGMSVVGRVPQAANLFAGAEWFSLSVLLIVMLVLGTAAYTGWRAVGVIDPQVWRACVWTLPPIALLGLLGALTSLASWVSADTLLTDDEVAARLLNLISWLALPAVAVSGLICVRVLRSLQILPIGLPLEFMLSDLSHLAGKRGTSLARVKRVNLILGLACGAAGLALILGVALVPLHAASGKELDAVKGKDALMLVAFYLLLRARRYLQVDADSLLAVDKRPPILFLRSFEDEKGAQTNDLRTAWLDFSLETRLANHFHHYGPFIAIGSSKESVPQPGAARVFLSEDQWQARVLEWMRTASVIILYAGVTRWVNWELHRVIGNGRATSLILMFPEFEGAPDWPGIGFLGRRKRRNDIAARAAYLRAAFMHTPWKEELAAYENFEQMRAMVFRPDGFAVVIKSRSRSREAYHLAALVAHHQLLRAPSSAESRDQVRLPQHQPTPAKPA